MTSRLRFALGVMALLLASAASIFITLSAFSAAPLTAAQGAPTCTQPVMGNESDSVVILPPPNESPSSPVGNLIISHIYSYYDLPPGGCALYSFILANTSSEAENWYSPSVFSNSSAVEWWLVPGSQLNEFFSSNYTLGYAVHDSGNRIFVLANPTRMSEWYFYAENKGNSSTGLLFSVVGLPNPLLTESGRMAWLALTLSPNEYVSFLYNASATSIDAIAGANSSSVEWVFSSGGRVAYSESWIDPNTTGVGSVAFTTEPGQKFNFTVLDEGDKPVYVAVAVNPTGLDAVLLRSGSSTTTLTPTTVTVPTLPTGVVITSTPTSTTLPPASSSPTGTETSSSPASNSSLITTSIPYSPSVVSGSRSRIYISAAVIIIIVAVTASAFIYKRRGVNTVE